MAYAEPRSVNEDLHTGMHEGGHCTPRKDWGGPHDARVRPPVSDSDQECQVDPIR